MIKKIILFLFYIFLLSFGIKWGLPKGEYKKFFYRNEKELENLLKGITEEYVKKSWEITKKYSYKKIERSKFNIIRSFHPDEENILKSISNMEPKKLDFNPHFFEYPSLYIYIVAITLKIASFFKLIKLNSDISFYFLNPDEISKFYLCGRIITLIFSVLTIFLLCKITEKTKGNFFVSFLVISTCPIYVINSIYMAVDIPMLFWIVLSLFFLLKYFENSKFLHLLLCSVFLGFATGTKYPALIFWFLVPITLFLKKIKLKEYFKYVAFSLFITMISFFFTTPYLLLSFNEFKRDFLYQFTTRGIKPFHPFVIIIHNTKEVLLDISLLYGLPMVFLFFILIIVLFLKIEKKQLIVFWGFILYILLLLLTLGFKYARYYLPLLPFVTLIFSFAIENIKDKIKILIYFLFSLVLVFNFLKTLSCLYLMNTDDTRIISAKYIDKEIKEGEKIVFLKSPWIFEVCPVNFFKYDIIIVENEKELAYVPSKSYLVIGELQYFLTKNSRKQLEEEIVRKMKNYDFTLIKKFEKSTFFYPGDITIHDLLYFCPKIFLFYKNERYF